jgi:hypothetical protein
MPAAIAKPIEHESAQEALSEFERHQDEAIDLFSNHGDWQLIAAR